jgi:HAD superfamily hydrolase (TIGR01509 family)
MPGPDAVLWDLDGTLVDTEPYWMDAESELAVAHGVEWTHEHAMTLVGLALLDAGGVLQRAGVAMEPAAIVDRMVRRVVERLAVEVPWRPGARELLAALADAGVPCALVTMSYTVIADAVVAGTPPGAFRAVVTGDAVRHGKPHPEPYLTAARRLGVAPERCVAIEDSQVGLASAEAAGTRALAVPHMVPIPPGPGRSRVPTLEGVTLADLAQIGAGEVVDRLPDRVG